MPTSTFVNKTRIFDVLLLRNALKANRRFLCRLLTLFAIFSLLSFYLVTRNINHSAKILGYYNIRDQESATLSFQFNENSESVV